MPAAFSDGLRRVTARSAPDSTADRELLTRFLEHRDEAAFAALVRRHGPAVFRTCRAVLADPHDAEDCFQATFLVLATKARSLALLIRNGNGK